jgi:large subunit ribosomal protein L4
MELKQYTLPGMIESEVMNVAESVFGAKYNQGLIWQAVNTYLAGARSGSKANKSRSEVRGGGIKPWRQKGLGRARAGSNTSPLWRTGGVTFAAKPRNYTLRMPKKMYRCAIRSLLSRLVELNKLKIVASVDVKNHKTKSALETFAGLLDKSLLIVVKDAGKDLTLAVRNLPNVNLIEAKKINPAVLSKASCILFTPETVKFCEEWLG